MNTPLGQLGLSEPTLYPALSPLRGATIHSIFFRSRVFVDAVQSDIGDLVEAFSREWQCLSYQSSSPFEVFRSIWDRMGWSDVHLLVLEPSWRPVWIQTVSRLFLERTHSSYLELHQIAALFGLYAFWASQPKGSAESGYRVYIPIDQDTLSNIRAIPEKFGDLVNSRLPKTTKSNIDDSSRSAIDPALELPNSSICQSPSSSALLDENVTRVSSLELKHSDDLHYVTTQLLRNQAFFLCPSVFANHPPLGDVTIQNQKKDETKAATTMLISINNELWNLAQSSPHIPSSNSPEHQQQHFNHNQSNDMNNNEISNLPISRPQTSTLSSPSELPSASSWLDKVDQMRKSYYLLKSRLNPGIGGISRIVDNNHPNNPPSSSRSTEGVDLGHLIREAEESVMSQLQQPGPFTAAAEYIRSGQSLLDLINPRSLDDYYEAIRALRPRTVLTLDHMQAPESREGSVSGSAPGTTTD